MKLFLTGTGVNLFFNLFLLCIVRLLYGQSRNLGWQKAEFRAERIKVRRYRRRRRTPYIYRADIVFRGGRYMLSVTTEAYEALCGNRTGSGMFYVREFPVRFLNPDFEKYEFSLGETDWSREDRRKCRKGFLAVFVPLELMLCILATGI